MVRALKIGKFEKPSSKVLTNPVMETTQESLSHVSYKVSNFLSTLANRFIWLFVAFLLIYLFWLAVQIKVNFFDTYSIFANAKGIGTGSHASYFKDRPTLLPLLIAPFFTLEKLLSQDGFGEVASRILHVVCFGLFLWMVYQFLKLHLSQWTALLGMLFCALNRILIHYAPFVREDIPGALFTASVFYFYLRLPRYQKISHYVCLSFLTAAAILMRFNLAPVIFSLIVSYEFLSGKAKVTFHRGIQVQIKDAWKKIIFLFVIPVTLFCVISPIVYVLAGRAPLGTAPQKFFHDRLIQIHTLKSVMEPCLDSVAQNVTFILDSFTLPVFCLVLIGFVRAWQKRQEGAFFHTLWFSIFFFTQCFLIRHNEVRYLFPLFLPLYYFAGFGLNELLSGLKHLMPKLHVSVLFQRGCVMTFFLSICAVPVRAGVEEMLRFQDPFYKSTIERDICRDAKQMAGGHQVWWLGTMYPIFPNDYVFDLEEKYAYVYHMYSNTCTYYLDEHIDVLSNFHSKVSQDWKRVEVKGIASGVGDGDVLLFNPETTAHMTTDLNELKSPLVMERVRILDFVPQLNMKGEKRLTFRSERHPFAKIYLILSENGLEISGAGFSDDLYELYFSVPKVEHPINISLFNTKSGQFSIQFSNVKKLPQLDKILLVTYDTAHPIWPNLISKQNHPKGL